MQFLAPIFKITLNGNENHGLNVISATFTDYEKDQSDCLSLQLAPNSEILNLGDRVELFLGVDSENFMGAFYVAAIKEQYKKGYSIECTSVDYSKGFKDKKSRTFENMSYEKILEAIAQENNLKAKINCDFAKSIETIEQVDESDSALCARLAQKMECSFCVKNDTLIFLDRDLEFQREVYEINADETQSLEIEKFAKTTYNSVELSYTDENGDLRIVKVGNKMPLYRMNYACKDDTHALQVAKSRLKSLNAKRTKGSISMVGRVIFAGGFLDLKINDDTSRHIISQVRHEINAKSWSINLDFESDKQENQD